MGSFSGLGIGLSFVFGCILMGLVAEVYYLLWWKKKLAKTSSINSADSSGEFQELNSLFFWRKPRSSSSSSSCSNTAQQNRPEIQDLEAGGLKCDEGIEAELMRVHNLCGPPRFLFTIKEESREDMESDDGKSRKASRTRSLSDLVLAVDGGGGGGAAFLSPLASPASLDSYNHHGINPLFESVTEAELGRLRSSPPPTFKFLRDAEEKLLRRLAQEEEERKKVNSLCDSEKCGSFVKFLAVKERVHNQVLPLPLPLPLGLPSSPTLKQG